MPCRFHVRWLDTRFLASQAGVTRASSSLLPQKCLPFQNMPCAWLVWVPGYLVKLPGLLIPSPWKWWSCLVSCLWPRGRRPMTGIQITTLILHSWGYCVFMASTEMSIRTSWMSRDVWRNFVERGNQGKEKEKEQEKRNSVFQWGEKRPPLQLRAEARAFILFPHVGWL